MHFDKKWFDQNSPSEGAVYQRLADALAQEFARGNVKVGTKLPGQRDLALSLGLNVTTVTRAYGQLQAQDLIESRPGRGTSVKRSKALQLAKPHPSLGFQSAPIERDGIIDLTLHRACGSGYLDVLRGLLADLPNDPRYGAIERYPPSAGPDWARHALGNWLGGLHPDQLVLTHGIQHALTCVLDAFTSPGDVLLTDALGYQGIHAICRTKGLQLVGVPHDQDGLQPDELERLCRTSEAKFLLSVPTFHNPTTITSSLQRRHALVEVARRNGLSIIEDGAYDLLDAAAPMTIRELAPELTVYIGGFSKCVSPGMRIGYVIGTIEHAQRVAIAMKVNCWAGNPLSALIITRLIEQEALPTIIGNLRQEIQARTQVARNELPVDGLRVASGCPHIWLPLPPPWRASGFVQALLQQGVSVLPSDAFAIGQEPAEHAVRINVTAPVDRDRLAQGIKTIHQVMVSPQYPDFNGLP